MCLVKKLMTILNVAEKNDAAKNIANFLSGGRAIKKESASKFNKLYEFSYNLNGSNADMIMTSVSGHLMNYEFPQTCKNWQGINPAELFEKPISKVCPQNYQPIKKSLEQLIRKCNMLIIWTDCDREGENIGMEIVNVCRAVKSNITVKRAKFSQITLPSVTNAINNLINMDEKASQAVDVRQELDLRIGASFTRLQTLHLRRVFPHVLTDQVISYGSCQFPTLGFVVERYKAIEDFRAEPFWKILLTHTKGNLDVSFNWDRVRLFEEDMVKTLLANITDGGSSACVFDINTKPKSKWRPTPMDTIEMEKLASRKLRISAKQTMQIAEKLYSQGYISYPRTETNIFPKDINLKPLVEIQMNDNRWGEFANRILNDGITPRNGKKSDQAHPPIHPLKSGRDLQNEESKIYELITRHFLACLHKDAIGNETKVSIECVSGNLGPGVWPIVNGQLNRSGDGEIFQLTGLVILARNYLDVYPYDKWTDKELPLYERGEIFQPDYVGIEQGATAPPQLLTEADLIQLMDKHGIGTDATHAEHISKVKERSYVGNTGPDDKYLVPGKLGMGLVEGYDLMGFYLARPNLRAKLETDLEEICRGMKQPEEVLAIHKEEYRNIFHEAVINISKLAEGVGKFIDENHTVNNSGFVTQTSTTAQLPVRACPSCSGFIIPKKVPTTSWMLGCTNYPSCNHTIWFPPTVEVATVAKDSSESPIICPNNHDNSKNHPVHKIALKFETRMNIIADIIPDEERNYVFCVYCHDEACSILDIRHHKANSAASTIRPTTNSSNNRRPVGVVNNFRSEETPERAPARSVISPSPSYSNPTSHIPSQNNNPENVPLCLCGQPSNKLKVFKEGPNKGRPFYACATQTCNSFFWGDTDNQSLPSSVPSTSTGQLKDHSMAGQGDGSAVNCDCKKPAKLLTVSKETANKGRPFYSCSNRTCEFFQWADDKSGGAKKSTTKKRIISDGVNVPNKKTFTSTDDMWPPMANDFQMGASGKSKTPRRCSRCKNPGHTVKTCPQNQ